MVETLDKFGTEQKHVTVVKKYPTYRDDKIYGCWKWLDGRRADDNAEGLWRVHDKLYDLKQFIKIHPGGKEWLIFTEGTDVTEAFEAYHITEKASKVLSKYYVREAEKPRNYKCTFKEDGFYRTLKRRAANIYENVDKSHLWKSKMIFDVNLFLFFLNSILFVRMEIQYIKFFFGLLAALNCAMVMGIVHNFIHQRSNWRNYASSCVMINFREYQVYHGLSHHLYPNTICDMEVIGYEPMFKWLPIHKKTKFDVIKSYLSVPIKYGLLPWLLIVMRVGGFIFSKNERIKLDDLTIFILPLAMLFFGGDISISVDNFFSLFLHWNFIMIVGGFIFSVMSVNAGHHGTTIIHEGDEFKDLDFGIHQLGAVIDRKEANSNLFMTLTHFGNHALHHMFPALDHSLLPQFRGVLFDTIKEFKTELREFSLLDGLIAQFEQLGRNEIIRLCEDDTKKM